MARIDNPREGRSPGSLLPELFDIIEYYYPNETTEVEVYSWSNINESEPYVVGIIQYEYVDKTKTKSAGSTDMKVDGSTTNVDFIIPASTTNDRYISSISFVIADAGSTLDKFGNITALTNGVQFFYSDDLGDVIIANALKTNFHFIRLCQGNPAFGDAATAFRGNNISGASEAYIPVLNFKTVFGYQWGIRLKAGSNQQLVIRVRDDVRGVDQFDAIAYGFDRLLGD